MQKRYWHHLLIFFVLMGLTVGLVACGEDDPDIDLDNDGDPEIDVEVDDNVDIDVSLENTQFVPATTTVDVGTTVVWTNNDSIEHTVTADNGAFGSNTLAAGDSFSFTFNDPGVYPYHCQFHGEAGGTGMAGSVVVEE